VDYRDWLFAITCDGFSDNFEAEYLDDAVNQKELLIVDIESIVRNKPPEFYVVERSLKEHIMGIYEMKPALYPANYR